MSSRPVPKAVLCLGSYKLEVVASKQMHGDRFLNGATWDRLVWRRRHTAQDSRLQIPEGLKKQRLRKVLSTNRSIRPRTGLPLEAVSSPTLEALLLGRMWLQGAALIKVP